VAVNLGIDASRWVMHAPVRSCARTCARCAKLCATEIGEANVVTTLNELLAPFGLAERDLVEAVAARLGPTASAGLPADQQVLLEAGGLSFDDADLHAAAAVAEIVADEAGCLASGLTVAQVAIQMGVSASRVRHLASDGGLRSVRTGRTLLLPAWQFDGEGRPLRGLRTVLAAMRPGEHPLAMQSFMATPQLDLEGVDGEPMTPREWLLSGGAAAAVAALLASDVW
jgi:excisionase family DNA binding protein